MRARLEQRREQRVRDIAAAQTDCHLASGERIEVFANLTGTTADATLAVAEGAEGCGLLRTEFLFLERTTAPDEDEQRRCYQQVAQILGARPLVIRTLDIGGDKPIPYLPLPPEDNPALGLRGVRTSLWRPDLLAVQLRALLAVQPAGQVRILLPMITDLEEIRAVRRMLDEVRGAPGVPQPVLGAMVETPAAAMLAAELAREVDFLSIGTNDLAQYTLAMDRGHAELARRIDGLHPAVLRLIDATCKGAAVHRCPVAVCGGLASDPAAAPVLLGLGVSELSVVPTLIPQLKSLIRGLTLDALPRARAARADTRDGGAGASARRARRPREENHLEAAAHRARAHVADRRAAGGGVAAAARPAGPAGCARHRRGRRCHLLESRACCSPSASPWDSRARITAPPASPPSSATWSRPRAPRC